jgi:hypothetical protein
MTATANKTDPLLIYRLRIQPINSVLTLDTHEVYRLDATLWNVDGSPYGTDRETVARLA